MGRNHSAGLDRFVEAQEDVYDGALSEIRSGRKTSHWMWFIFPQFAGLGASETSRFYAIKSIDEAREYLRHPLLGPRLIECAEAVLSNPGVSARDIFGSPDDMKLKSCMTLFAYISSGNSVFDQVLDKFYGGERDPRTIAALS
ncbi:MAG: DUF1810 domain-containing protein [Gemmatimonadaceae bacterium]